MLFGIKLDVWGLIVGGAALILTFPLSLLANIATPHLRDWWAERSTRSANVLLVSLYRTLHDYEKNYPLVDPSLILIMQGALATIRISVLCTGALCLNFVALVKWDLPQSLTPNRQALEVLLLSAPCLIYLFVSLYGFWAASKISLYVRRHSAQYRCSLKESISKLERYLGG
jgi:hypothetical protein